MNNTIGRLLRNPRKKVTVNMDMHLRKRLSQYIYDPKLLESYLVSSVNINYKEEGK